MHSSAGILGPYGGPTYNKLQHLVLNAHSLPISVQNEIPEVEKNSLRGPKVPQNTKYG